MKRTSMILTIAAVVSLSSAVKLQSRLATQLAHPVIDNTLLVETAAAVLFGGDEVQYAQATEQALNQITFNFAGLKQKLKEKAIQAAKQQANKYLGGALAQSDEEVATYILSEIANGNPTFMRAFAEVSVNGVNAAQTESDSSFWQKLRELFGKKSSAQVNEQLEAEVANYIRAQGQAVFEDLGRMLSQARQVPDDDEEEEDEDEDEDLEAQIQQAVQTYILQQSLAQSNDEFETWFAQANAEERSEFFNIKDKIKQQLLKNINKYKDSGLAKLKGALGDNYDLVAGLAKPMINDNAAIQKLLKEAEAAKGDGNQDAGTQETAPAAAQVVATNLRNRNRLF